MRNQRAILAKSRKIDCRRRNFTLAAAFSPLVQYPIDVSKDLLLIYNTNSADSLTVLNYYLANRPMVSNANVLGIGYTNDGVFEGTNYYNYYETMYPEDFTNDIATAVLSWLSNNATEAARVCNIVFGCAQPCKY